MARNMELYHQQKAESWKSKAISRGLLLKLFKQLVGELRNARDKWRRKYEASQSKLHTAEKRIKDLELELKKTDGLTFKPKPARHCFDSEFVLLMVSFKLKSSASFRGLQRQQEIRRDLLGESGMAPSHSCISNWVLKIGLHELRRQQTKAADWVIILDTSIQMGQEKVLVVLGIRQIHINKLGRPLVFEDLVPLAIEVRQSWKGEDVEAVVAKLQTEIGTVTYAVADHGGELRKGLRLAGVRHVHDVTHAIALLVERVYKADLIYLAFCAQLSAMRLKLCQTDVAHIVPQAQRKKSPYQNIRPITVWAHQMLAFLASPEAALLENARVAKELQWLKGYQELIDQMHELVLTINHCEKLLKHNGLTKRTVTECNAIMSRLTDPSFAVLREEFVKGLQRTLDDIADHQLVLCSSDIIESMFGAYKNFVSNNKMAGVTKLVLVMAALTCDLTLESIKESLEGTTAGQLREWDKECIGRTLYKRRRDICNQSQKQEVKLKLQYA